MDSQIDYVPIMPNVKPTSDSFLSTYKYYIIGGLVVLFIIILVTWLFSKKPADKEGDKPESNDKEKERMQARVAAAKAANAANARVRFSEPIETTQQPATQQPAATQPATQQPATTQQPAKQPAKQASAPQQAPTPQQAPVSEPVSAPVSEPAPVKDTSEMTDDDMINELNAVSEPDY